MAKPATEARLSAAANGFTEVIGRGDAHILTRNPATGKCAYDGQVGGGWHYNGDQETDTAWEADSDQNYLKMVKAGYNLRARKLFSGGDLIQWTDPLSGQWVKFQPVNFQWIDGTTGSNSVISVAQAVASPSIDDDKLYWANAFGPNRHFQYTASPTSLIKHLIIPSSSDIPACPSYITNPFLELTFTLTPSSGVTLYVDGVAWDGSTAKSTANAIEFRLNTTGAVVWSMAAPLAYDSSEEGNPGAGTIHLYVNKKIKYASVRFPKTWVDSAVFPIMLDPSLDYQVGASADDGYMSGSSTFDNTGAYLQIGYGSGNYRHFFARFATVTIPAGATIDVAYAQVQAYGSWSYSLEISANVYGDDEDAASAVADRTDFIDRLTNHITTAYTEWSITDGESQTSWTDNIWYSTPSLVTVISELIGSYDYSSGNVIQLFFKGISGTTYRRCSSYDDTGNASGPKLHIEYTEAASGNPFYAYAQQ